MITDAFGKVIQNFYETLALERSLIASELLYGKIIGYRKKEITRYLYIPIPFIEKHYDSDYEYGTGEFEGLLIGVRWIETPIPVRKEIIEVPIRHKSKGQKIKFRRYASLNQR